MAKVVPVEVAHHDAARAQVSMTALAVCALRAHESKKPENERLIFDPLASKLCGSDLPDINLLSEAQTGKSTDFWIDFLAVRTRWIDDMLVALTPKQLVILGAGLDCRAYRLEALRAVPTYEVDFPEVLAAKQTLLQDEAPLAELRTVKANLSINDWVKELCTAGLRADHPSVWLLEGLVGYLTQEELAELFGRVRTIAAPGSKLVISFVGQGMKEQATDMHKFLVSSKGQAEEFLVSHGWSVKQSLSLSDIAASYNRAEHIPGDYSYYLLVAECGSPSASRL